MNTPASPRPLFAVLLACALAAPGAIAAPTGARGDAPVVVTEGVTLAQGKPPPTRTCRKRRGTFYFNFEETSIFDVLKKVSLITCRNFIVSEGVKGGKKELTIISQRPVNADQAYAAFLSALEANNMALIPAGRFYKVVERKDAVRDALPMYDDKGSLPWTDAQVTLLYELQHTSKEQVNSIIRNLLSKTGDVQMLGGGLLIITDSAANIRRLVKILDKVDVAGSSSRIHVVDIVYAEAAQVSQKLTDIFADSNTRGGSKAKPARRSTGKKGDEAGEALEDVAIEKIIADERTNKLIIIASVRAFKRVKEVIDLLDVPGDDNSSGSRVFVHPLNNADAQKAASTLSGVAQGQRSNKKSKGKGGAELFEGEVKVNADEATNSLVVVASARDYRALAKVIEQLDVKRPQVFVEAAILEVSLTQSRNFGIDAYSGVVTPVPGFEDPGLGILANQGGQQLVTSSAQALAAQELFNQLNANTLDATNLAGVVDATSSLENLLGWLAFRGPALDSNAFGFPVPSFGVVLNALQTNTNVDVLSTPHIMTTDNEKAEISVGERIPVVRGISPVGGGGGGAGGFFGGLQQVAYEDVKLKFTVTPHVNVDDDIRLELEQEVSDLGGQVPVGNGLNQPIITNRSAKTTVVVKDQQTVIVGGLIANRKSDSESKFPFLGDIPLVGWLFKQWNDSDNKTNLILVMTPYVVRDREDFQEIYERKLRERQEFVEAFFGKANAYNPYVDYRKKTGPLARLLDDVEAELTKIENGGPGLPGEVAITPEAPIAPFEAEEEGEDAGDDTSGASPAPASEASGDGAKADASASDDASGDDGESD